MTADVKAELAKMQEEAKKLVAEECAKLQAQAAAEVQDSGSRQGRSPETR